MDIEKARKKTYGGNNRPYVEGQCVESVSDVGGFYFYQCSKANGYGENKLYCKRHGAKFDAKSMPKETVYRPSRWGTVDSFEIVGETDRTWKTMGGHTRMKEDGDTRSFKEAWDVVVAYAEQQVLSSTSHLERAKKRRDEEISKYKILEQNKKLDIA